MIERAPHPVRWLVLDLVSMDDIDYTGGLTLAATLKSLRSQGLTIALAQAEDVAVQLRCFGIVAILGENRVFDSVAAALDAFNHAGLPGQVRVRPGAEPVRLARGNP